MFRKKTNKYHAAAGEIRRYREQTVRLNAHRVSPVNDRSYAVGIPGQLHLNRHGACRSEAHALCIHVMKRHSLQRYGCFS